MVRPAFYFVIPAGILLILAPVLLYSIQHWKQRRIEKIRRYSEQLNRSAAARLERKAAEKHTMDHDCEWRRTGTS